jgi:hypothetical protein
MKTSETVSSFANSLNARYLLEEKRLTNPPPTHAPKIPPPPIKTTVPPAIPKPLVAIAPPWRCLSSLKNQKIRGRSGTVTEHFVVPLINSITLRRDVDYSDQIIVFFQVVISPPEYESIRAGANQP